LFWAWDIRIPASTSESAPITQILKLSHGVITRIDLKFPAGCHGYAKVRINRWEFQLVPLNRNEWCTGDDETIPTELYYELTEEPYQLKFIGCSPDADYDHTITVRVSIVPRWAASLIPLVELLTKAFKKLGIIK